MVIIGLDPHPASHTAAALNAQGRVLSTCQVDNAAAGLAQLEIWAAQYPARTWAIEGANNPFTRPLTQQLLAQGERVHHIHPGLTSQYRARRTQAKTEAIDAEHAARALLANPKLPPYRRVPHQVEWQGLTRNRDRLAQNLKANQMALHSLPADDSAEVIRSALSQVIAALQAALKQLEQHLRCQVRQHAPQLLDQVGIGPVIAGTLLAEVGDMGRFGSRDQFARYCGTAPVPRGSGGTLRWCVCRGGNRRLNRALHLIALSL